MSALFALLLTATACAEAADAPCHMEELKAEALAIADAGRKLPGNKPWPADLRKRVEAANSRAIDGWGWCAHRKASEYATLPETAEAVANAAMTSCSDWAEAAQIWMAVLYQANGEPTSAAASTFASIERTNRENLASFVMDMRVRKSARQK